MGCIFNSSAAPKETRFENIRWSEMKLAEASLVSRSQALFLKVPALFSGLFSSVTPLPSPIGAVTLVRMYGRHIDVEVGPSRTQTLLNSAGERASPRRCRSRRMKAARCMASWKSTRYRRNSGRAGPAGLWVDPAAL